jgi:hypothetical protein
LAYFLQYSSGIDDFWTNQFCLDFFRAKDFQTASYIVSHLFTDLPQQISQLSNSEFFAKNVMLNKGELNFVMVILALIMMESVHWAQRGVHIRERLSQKPLWFRWLLYYGIIFATLFMGMYQAPAQFIYFQF